MFAMIEHMKEYLRSVGVTPGERVAILCENSIEYFALVIAIWQESAVVVPVSTRYTKAQIDAVFNDVNCDEIFVSAKFSDLKLDASMHLIDRFGKLDKNQMPSIMLKDIHVDLEDDASIIFTSGSSGNPKGVLHTFSNHYFSALGSDLNIPFRKGDSWLMSLPMYHISGFSLIMRSLLNGGTIVFPETAESLADSIAKTGVTHLSLVPSQLKQLMRDPKCMESLRRFKAILLGGSAIPDSLMDEAAANDLAIHITYGSTEMASQVATSSDIAEPAKIFKYRDAIIAADGEICVKGRTLFQGYVSGDSCCLPLDEDGYFHTGDIGAVDTDGRLTVVGRKDLMFISGGENIYPEEIERAIAAIEHIETAVVVAVDCPDFGKRPVAFMKMQDGYSIDPDAIVAKLGEAMEGFKVPIAFYSWPDQHPIVKPPRKLLQKYAAGIRT